MKILCKDEEHIWIEKPIQDSCGFGVTFGAVRKCTKCGKYQICSYCEGRTGGPWRDVIGKGSNKVKKFYEAN